MSFVVLPNITGKFGPRKGLEGPFQLFRPSVVL